MNTRYHYDKGFKSDTLLGSFDIKIRDILKSQLSPNDAWVNDNWIKLDDDLKALLSKNHDRVVVYSGIDWERSREKPDILPLLQEQNTIYIGNSYGKYYFSWWMEFIYSNLDKFLTFDPYKISSDIKPYMCLNRKPHWHRVKFVKTLQDYGLISRGHVSLGRDPSVSNYLGLDVPILLEKDIINTEGDSTTWGEVGGITNDITSLGSEYYWNSHFINVVTETTTSSDVFLSEKIFKPIIGRRPFVLIGDERAYDLLHSWGIDTFDDFFGTGYKEKDIFKRIEWAAESISSYSHNRHLKEILYDIKPRLESNYKAFLRAAEENRYKIHNLFS